MQQRDLVRHRHVERIGLVGRDPSHLPVGWLIGKLDPFPVDGGRNGGDVDSVGSCPRGGLWGEVAGPGEAPGAVLDHTDCQANIVGIDQGLKVRVGQPDVLSAV